MRSSPLLLVFITALIGSAACIESPTDTPPERESFVVPPSVQAHTGYARLELDRVAESVTAYDAADVAVAERVPLPPGVTARYSNFIDCFYHLVIQLGNDPDNVMFLCDGLPP